MTPPSRRRTLVELVALCGFAFTQPLLDVFGRTPDLFVLRDAGAAQIVAFAVVVALGPPLVLWVLELAVRWRSERSCGWLHLGLLTLLTAAVVVQIERQHVGGAIVYVAALLLAVVVIQAYRDFGVVRMWVGYLAWAPVGFVVLFLVSSPTSHLLADDPPLADVTPGAPAPVVVVILDELPLSSLIDRDGAIDRDLFPNLASLADDAHWYRNTTSVAPGTYHAVPAILTGQLTETGQGPGAADHPESLFTLLGASSHPHVEEAITHLCPGNVCARPSSWTVLGDLLQDAGDAMRSRLGIEPWADPVTARGRSADPAARLRRFIDDITDDPQGLHVEHLMLPHRPYRFLPDGTQYAAPRPEIGLSRDLVWSDDPWPTTLARQRLLLQTQYVDVLLGRAFDRLRDLGIYDDALVVVTADHGVSFDPGTVVRPVFGQPLSSTSSTDLLWVPLLIKEPGQTRGEVSDVNALTIDILPTMADILDVDIPWEVDGRSLLGAPRVTDDKPWRPTVAGGGSIDVGEEITVDGAAGLRDLSDRTLSDFLPAAGASDRIWRVGPRADLVGEAVDGLPGGTLERLGVDLDVDVGGGPAGTVPALVRAHGPDLEIGQRVAVALDGRIAATGVVFDERGRPEVAVMVDHARLAAEGATIQVYRIV